MKRKNWALLAVAVSATFPVAYWVMAIDSSDARQQQIIERLDSYIKEDRERNKKILNRRQYTRQLCNQGLLPKDCDQCQWVREPEDDE